MNKETYINTLKNPNSWFDQAFSQKLVADKILNEVIMKREFLVKLKETQDDVILHEIGGKASKSHDLYALANRAGILGKNKKGLPFNVNVKLTKNVLQNLSVIIRWASRYPIPVNSSKVFQMDEDVPHVCVYGFHILDTIGFFFDYFELQVESD